jgi:hypothetical protein
MRKIYFFLFILFAFTTSNSYAYNFTGHSEHDSCSNGVQFYATINAVDSYSRILTYFGDGDTASRTVYGSGYHCSHLYSSLGTYTIKHVLIRYGLRIDSVQFSVNLLCQTAFIRLYKDNNSNCIYDREMLILYLLHELRLILPGLR